MKKISNPKYSKKEEKLNVLTHAFGLIMSIVGLPFLLLKSLQYNGFWKPFSIVIFGVSLIVLYAASTFYHASKDSELRRKLNIFDHAAIYFLIAGYGAFKIEPNGASISKGFREPALFGISALTRQLKPKQV